MLLTKGDIEVTLSLTVALSLLIIFVVVDYASPFCSVARNDLFVIVLVIVGSSPLRACKNTFVRIVIILDDLWLLVTVNNKVISFVIIFLLTAPARTTAVIFIVAIASVSLCAWLPTSWSVVIVFQVTNAETC